jgi:hypothetical protein
MTEKAKKMGRPKLPEERSRTGIMTFRLSSQEREQIEKTANKASMRLSDWIRKILLDASK